MVPVTLISQASRGDLCASVGAAIAARWTDCSWLTIIDKLDQLIVFSHVQCRAGGRAVSEWEDGYILVAFARLQLALKPRSDESVGTGYENSMFKRRV